MITITLLPHVEKLAPDGAVPGYQESNPLLYHQARTYAALQATPLVMNTYPTGTGKTIAALLRLLHPDQRGQNTLLIAPTNALIDQHAEDTQTFIERHHLGMRVFKANAAALDQLAPELRKGETLQRHLENPLTFAEQLGLPDDAEKQPFVVVTNPDIFYLALYFQYGRNDQRNVFSKFIGRFRYIVIDEFHYYDNKQFANFLFFFALWKQWGYFEHGHSVCLLSATPRQNVYTYLDRVFAENWNRIGPDNEPPESANYATTPTLTELRMTIVTDQITEWVEENRAQVATWQANALDSVIISSSLSRINEMRYTLRRLKPVRITGPEPQSERQRVRPVILATPTVDIGYNFGRPGKLRQSIDRLVCDARFGDELTQRIGRAGRVLGRQETTQPSEAVVMVSDDAMGELRVYDGQALSRHAWATIVAELAHLPPKHQLEGYIRSQAIVESFYPIYHIHKLMPPDEPVLEELFQMIRTVFAPRSTQKTWMLKTFFQKYDRRRRWLNLADAKRWATGEHNIKDLAQHFADYICWRKSTCNQRISEQGEKYRKHLPQLLLNQPQQKKDLHTFINSQVALTKALFSFREAWQGPSAAVYDLHQLLSSETINQYDLLHLVANYNFHLFRDKAEFEHAYGSTDPAALYLRLDGFRDPKLALGFDYLSRWNRTEFEERHCRSVVALQGLHLTARERGLNAGTVTLPTPIYAAIAEDWIPCLIVAEESWWPLLSVLRGTPFYTRELQVDFPDGGTVTYKVITGTAAFHVLPALKWHFAMLDKNIAEDAIIL